MKLKKPKFWDYKKPNIIAYFLLPFTLPVIFNNFLLRFKKNNKNIQKIKKICIGNIYVGGTAKTPLSINITKTLNNLNFKTATIKKFYSSHSDEQKLLAEKTKLYCFKKRKKALNEAIKDNVDIAIFDDGLQDRSISYDLKIVCFNNIKLIGNGLLLPAGPLREKINSLKKYDAVFINGNKRDNTNFKSLIKKYNKDIKIFESFYAPVNINQFNIDEKYVIFSGIGNPKSFKDTLIQNKFNIIKEFIFPDHYEYTQNDIHKIKLEAKSLNAKVLTTEKDYVKINFIESDDIQFLKIDLDIKNEDEFINYLKLKI